MRRPIGRATLPDIGAPMADVQLEKGYTRTANQLEEAIIWAPFTGTEFRIVSAIKRLTYGWRRRTVRIAQPDLAEKCRTKMNGGFRRAFESLVVEGVIIEVEGPTGRAPGAYALNKNFERWGRYSVPASGLEAVFKDRPNHVDDSDRAKRRIAAASADEFQRDLGLDADAEHDEDGQGDRGDEDRSMPPEGQSTAENEARSMSLQGQSTKRSMTLQGGLTDPVGRIDCPPRDSHDGSNSASDNGLRPPKDIERHRNTAAGKKEAAAAAVDDVIGSTEFESRIVAAARAGVAVRWPGKTISVKHAGDVVSAWIAAGVDVELAVQTIRISLARKLGDAPGSVAWLKDRVLDAHRDRAHEALKHEAGEEPKRRRRSSASSIADIVEPDLRPEYDEARKAAAIAHFKRAENSAVYRSIVADSNARFGDMLSASWGVAGRDRDVLDRCIAAVPFPSFDQWKTERKGTEQAPQSPKPRGRK